MCVLIFSTAFVRNICHSKMKSVLYFFENSQKKLSDMKILENPTSQSRIIPREQTDGRTDRHTHTHTHKEANSHLLQFCEGSYKCSSVHIYNVSKNKIMNLFCYFVHGNSYCTLMRLCSFWLLFVLRAGSLVLK